MSSFREVNIPKEAEQPKVKEVERPALSESDSLLWNPDNQSDDTANGNLSDVYDSVFKSFGLTAETNSEKKSETNEASESEDYLRYLEKGEDGKYYDKETGKAYDSIEAWEKVQETLARRYESTARYYEDKAKKEWARFKNAEQNGESDAEKWEHYRRSQEYYAKAKECKEKADHIREKLGQTVEKSNAAISFNSQDVVPKRGTSEYVEAYDKLPKEKQEAIKNSFKDAPNEIKALVAVLSRYLSVDSVKESDNVRVCNYSFLDKTIRMEPNLSDDEYAEVFTHEYGHFVDDMLGRPSASAEFRDAMNKDRMQYHPGTDAGMENFERMIDELLNSDAAYDRMVSDVLSAFFVNDSAVMQRYEAEGFSYFGHSNEYWSRAGAREAEVFANSFSVAAQDNSDSCAFMKTYFPNTWEQMMKILAG